MAEEKKRRRRRRKKNVAPIDKTFPGAEEPADKRNKIALLLEIEETLVEKLCVDREEVQQNLRTLAFGKASSIPEESPPAVSKSPSSPASLHIAPNCAGVGECSEDPPHINQLGAEKSNIAAESDLSEENCDDPPSTNVSGKELSAASLALEGGLSEDKSGENETPLTVSAAPNELATIEEDRELVPFGVPHLVRACNNCAYFDLCPVSERDTVCQFVGHIQRHEVKSVSDAIDAMRGIAEKEAKRYEESLLNERFQGGELSDKTFRAADSAFSKLSQVVKMASKNQGSTPAEEVLTVKGKTGVIDKLFEKVLSGGLTIDVADDTSREEAGDQLSEESYRNPLDTISPDDVLAPPSDTQEGLENFPEGDPETVGVPDSMLGDILDITGEKFIESEAQTKLAHGELPEAEISENPLTE